MLAWILARLVMLAAVGVGILVVIGLLIWRPWTATNAQPAKPTQATSTQVPAALPTLDVPATVQAAVGTALAGVATPTAQVATQVPAAQPTNAPAPAATTAPASQPTSTGMYNIPPQPEIGHPSLYLETGVPCQAVPQGTTCSNVSDHTKTWSLDVLPGTVAIIGGFTVDGTSQGVYKAVGPGHLTTTVTDGFIAVTKTDWGNPEWCFRISQAVQYGWAHSHESPLQGWSCTAQ